MKPFFKSILAIAVPLCVLSSCNTRDNTCSKDVDNYDFSVGNCKVTFNSSIGSKVDSQIVQYDGKLTAPEDPVVEKVGFEEFTFAGWYTADFRTKWDFDNDTVDKNMTLYARWYKDEGTTLVTYDTGDHEVTYAAVGETEGIADPEMKWEGHRLSSWSYINKCDPLTSIVFSNSEFGKPLDAYTRKNHNNMLWLRAGWETKGYTVRWRNDDNEDLQIDYDVPYGSHPTYNAGVPVANKTKDLKAYEYKQFIGWKDEKTGEWYCDDYNVPSEAVTLIAQYELKTHDFVTESWEQLVSEINSCKSIEALHAKYKFDCDSNEEFPGTLIGVEKEIEVFGRTQKVRVIGENHDRISNTSNVALLTFEFSNLISDNLGNQITVSYRDWDITACYNSWVHSRLRRFMSYLKGNLPTAVRNGVKKVRKETYETTSYTSGYNKFNDETLFPLCTRETGIAHGHLYNQETSCTAYAYYTKGDKHAKFLKKDLNGKTPTLFQHTRSPAGYRIQYSFGYWEDVKSITIVCCTIPISVSPAFCI